MKTKNGSGNGRGGIRDQIQQQHQHHQDSTYNFKTNSSRHRKKYSGLPC